MQNTQQNSTKFSTMLGEDEKMIQETFYVQILKSDSQDGETGCKKCMMILN